MSMGTFALRWYRALRKRRRPKATSSECDLGDWSHMSEAPDILSADEMKRWYGSFYDRGSKSHLDPRKVPKRYWPLLPYAEFWGIADDWARDALVKDAPAEVRLNLKQVVGPFDTALDEWLAGPEADGPEFSSEYIAYSAMRRAADCV